MFRRVGLVRPSSTSMGSMLLSASGMIAVTSANSNTINKNGTPSSSVCGGETAVMTAALFPPLNISAGLGHSAPTTLGQVRFQMGNMRPGDWSCTACQAHNFASKTECHRCRGPKGAEAGGNGGGQQGGGYGQQQQQGGGGQQQQQQREMRPGDWSCNGCKAHNFAKNNSCFKCQGPRSQDQVQPPVQAQSGFGGGYGGSSDGGGFGGGFGGGYGGGGGRGGGGRGRGSDSRPAPPRRPGDWDCNSCGQHNFGNKTECFKCQGPRAPDQGPQPRAWKEGDWECRACQHHNFAKNPACIKCEGPRGADQGTPPPLPIRREGDWDCRDCGFQNFRIKEACHRCKGPRAPDQMWTPRPPPIPRHDDWECRACQASNFNSRSVCHKCQGPREEDQGVAPEQVRRPGDFDCKKCGHLNFNRAEDCRKCGEPRDIDQPQMLVKGRKPVDGYSGIPPKGVWTCSCGWLNPKHSGKCAKCNIPGMGGEVGDWTCPCCESANFAATTVCRGCQETRP